MNFAKKASALLLLAVSLSYLSGCVVAPYPGYSTVSVGGSVAHGELDSFYFALGEYYGIPERDVYFIHERHMPDHDIPVVLFISRYARVSSGIVINLRLSGMSWMDISRRYGLSPEIYYVPVKTVYGAPYGKAYGYYQNRNRNEWYNIRLADDDVVNMVNLRFISERYNYPPEDVMRMRSAGSNFVNINDDVRRKKSGDGQPQRNDARQEQDQNRVRQEQDRTRQEQDRARQEQEQRQEREIRQDQRKDARESVRQQLEQEKAARQQPGRQDSGESKDAAKPPAKKKGLSDDKDVPPGQKDKK